MKRLIEKSIGAILLCLQIIMAAATACSLTWKTFGTIFFLCRYSYEEDGAIASLLMLACLAISSIAVIIVGSVVGLVLTMPIGHVVHKSGRYMKSNYGFREDGHAPYILHKEYDRCSKMFNLERLMQGYYYNSGIKSVDSLYYSPLERLLMYSNLGFSIYRSSKEDIENERDKASSDLAFYCANASSVQSKYNEIIKRREKRNTDVSECVKILINKIKRTFTLSNIQNKASFVNLKSWISGCWFLIIYCIYLAFTLNLTTYRDLPLFFAGELFVISIIVCMYFNLKDEYGIASFSSSVSCEYTESTPVNYKKSAFDFVDYLTARWYYAFGKDICMQYNILDIFQAFLDLHKEGWRMKIFPFSAERVRQEKADAAARGEEIVIFPDVDEIEARLAEEERKEQRLASIGEL